MSELGQLSGLQAVLEENRPRFLQFARRCGAGAEADDVIQDCWLRIRRVEGPVGNPEAYIYRTIYNIARDRRRGDRRSIKREQAWDAVMGERDADPAETPAAERALLAREEIIAAQARLVRLGEPALTIFVRHRLRGEVQAAIARDMGLGVSTVEKHLRRAYHALLELRSTPGDG